MEKFNLKWNDFQPNISASFKKLRNHCEFHDVTLVSNDQKQVSAHKVVLSACSAFFRNILEKNKHQHPMLCLDGISSAQLDKILDYIYFGEVTICPETINKFFEIAERLQLDGLITSKEEEGKVKNSQIYDVDTSSDSISIGGEFFPHEFQEVKNQNSKINKFLEMADSERLQPEEKEGKCKNNQIHDEDTSSDSIDGEFFPHEYQEVDTKFSVSHTSSKIKQRKGWIMVNAGNISSVDELDIYIKGKIIGTADGKQCGICFYTPKHPHHLTEHIETHLEGLSFKCDNCNKSMCNRAYLRKHKKSCAGK